MEETALASASGRVERRLRVALVALPEAAVSTLAGIFDVLQAPASLDPVGIAAGSAFRVEIVGEAVGPLELASGVPMPVQRSIDTIESCDIVIVPSIMLGGHGWQTGRYPQLVAWLARMHAAGAVLCSACSGIFLLAETGLFDNRDATVHFGLAQQFARTYPLIRIHAEQALVIAGTREELVSSGASQTWHDLVLYLIARFVGATEAQAIARLYALQWHQEGLAPFITFEGRIDHGDAEIAAAQQWLGRNFAVAAPVEQAIGQSRLAARTFKRRFLAATGLTPLSYVQRLRIEDAKRRLERTDDSVDEISWRVGYEDAAFFRRLFRRTTGMSPGAYAKRFRIPAFARSQRADRTG